MLAVVIGLCAPSVAMQAAGKPTDLQKARAACVMFFAKGTTWPENDSVLRIVVVGRDDIGPILDATMKQALKQPVQIDRISRHDVDKVGNAHIAIFSDAMRRDYRALAAICREHDVLSIAEHVDFLEAGGIATVGLNEETGKPRLQVNRDALVETDLKIAAGLLKNCEVVRKGTG